MGDIGIKLSQLGYNVKSADDKNLIFSSAWKSLKIRDTGVEVPNSSNFTLNTHNLDYFPFALAFNEYDFDGNLVAGTSRMGGIRIEDDRIWINAPPGNTGYKRWFLFDLDLEENYDAPSVELTPASQEGSLVERDFGVKLTLPGFDVLTETDWRNFVIHSRTRSPMVHRVVHDSKALDSNPFDVYHNLGYTPTFFVFAKLAGNDYYQLLQTATDTFASSDTEKLSVFLPYECDYSIVILKDPLLLSS